MFNSTSKKGIGLAKKVKPVLSDLSARVNNVLSYMDRVRDAAAEDDIAGVINGLDIIANTILDAEDMRVNNGFINAFIDDLKDEIS